MDLYSIGLTPVPEKFKKVNENDKTAVLNSILRNQNHPLIESLLAPAFVFCTRYHWRAENDDYGADEVSKSRQRDMQQRECIMAYVVAPLMRKEMLNVEYRPSGTENWSRIDMTPLCPPRSLMAFYMEANASEKFDAEDWRVFLFNASKVILSDETRRTRLTKAMPSKYNWAQIDSNEYRNQCWRAMFHDLRPLLAHAVIRRMSAEEEQTESFNSVCSSMIRRLREYVRTVYAALRFSRVSGTYAPIPLNAVNEVFIHIFRQALAFDDL